MHYCRRCNQPLDFYRQAHECLPAGERPLVRYHPDAFDPEKQRELSRHLRELGIIKTPMKGEEHD